MSDYDNIYACARDILSKQDMDCILVTDDHRQLATLALNHRDMNDWKNKYETTMALYDQSQRDLVANRNSFQWLQPVVENLAKAVAKDRSDY